jgi:lipoprotein-anchoring transpeptidase ErfK/SrfK
VVLVTAASLLTVAASPASVSTSAGPGAPKTHTIQNQTTQLDTGENKGPGDSEGNSVYREAMRTRGARILVSTKKRHLWYVQGSDTLLSAPVAIGMGTTFEYNGKNYLFATPHGKRVVQQKVENPIWLVPEWHYYEKASQRGLQVVKLQKDKPYMLDDGTWLEIRGKDVGRVNQYGNWWPFSQDFEIMFDDKIFMPPMGTNQRQVTNALGPYKLDMGEGYLIHGTHEDNVSSIGQAVSHGCVRMRNEDLTQLYDMVSPGTPVFIF